LIQVVEPGVPHPASRSEQPFDTFSAIELDEEVSSCRFPRVELTDDSVYDGVSRQVLNRAAVVDERLKNYVKRFMKKQAEQVLAGGNVLQEAGMKWAG